MNRNRVVLIAIINLLVACALGWWCGTIGAVLAAVIVIVTAGGVIAYIGDLIGYSLGKKRVSLFGLRPRDTANIIGIAAGAFSALAAFAILLGVNDSFRHALFHANELMHSIQTLEQKNESYVRQIDDTLSKLNQAKAQVDSAVTSMQLAQTQLKTVKGTLGGVQTKLSGAQTDLQRRQEQLTHAIGVLKTQKILATSLEQKNRTAREVLHGVVALTNRYAGDVGVALGSKLVYRHGQEVGRGVIPNGSVSNVLSSLSSYLDTLSKKATKVGAGAQSNLRAVKIADVQFYDAASKSKNPAPVGSLPEAESLQALAEQIHNSRDASVVLVASSVGNSFAGQQVQLRIWPYGNHLVIPAGTVLGRVTIPNASSASPTSMMVKIYQMLVSMVRPAAIRAGVIPFYAYDGAAPELGNLKDPQMIEACIQASKIDGDAIIEARSSKDVWSGDTLELVLHVSPANAYSQSSSSSSGTQ